MRKKIVISTEDERWIHHKDNNVNESSGEIFEIKISTEKLTLLEIGCQRGR